MSLVSMGGNSGFQPSQDIAIKRGTYTQMRAYSATAGDMWYDTDHNITWVYNRNSWRPIPGDPRVSRWWLYDMDRIASSDTFDWNTIAAAGTSMPASDAEINRPGVFNMNISTSGNALTFYHGTVSVLPGQGIMEITIGMRFDGIGAAGEEFDMRLGLGDANGAYNDGINFLYRYGTYGNVFRGETTKGGSTTTGTVDSAALVNATWYDLMFRVTESTKVEFFFNGTLFDTITTNIPNVAFSNSTGPMVRLAKTAGNAAKAIRLDYYDYLEVFTTTRGIP